MNINDKIRLTLETQNGEYHEASRCVKCEPGVNVPGAVWLDEADLPRSGIAGYPIYYRSGKVLSLPFTHTLVMGSTGTGKSEVFYKNQIKLLAALPADTRPSLLVTDLKGDISAGQAEYLRSQGYEVSIFNMRTPYRTDRFNFLVSIYDNYHEALRIKRLIDDKKIDREFLGTVYPTEEEARAVAEEKRLTLLDKVERDINEITFIIIPDTDQKDKTWSTGARLMLNAIIRTMLRDSDEDKGGGMNRQSFTIANVCRIAFSTEDDCDFIISWLGKAEDDITVRNAIGSTYSLSAKGTRDGYVTSLNTPLSRYASSSIAALTATDGSINIRKLARSEKPQAIFVITDSADRTTSDLCMLFMNSLLNELTDFADRREDKQLPRDFVVLADEFANMPPMPDMDLRITTLRSKRIWMTMAVQSLKQLVRVYGDDVSEIIYDNCDLHIFIGCNDESTKERFASSMGQRLGVKTTFSISNDGSVSATKGTENVPVIRLSDLDSLQLGEFFIRSRQAGKLRSYITPFFSQTEEERWRTSIADVRHPFNPRENVYSILTSNQATLIRRRHIF